MFVYQEENSDEYHTRALFFVILLYGIGNEYSYVDDLKSWEIHQIINYLSKWFAEVRCFCCVLSLFHDCSCAF